MRPTLTMELSPFCVALICFLVPCLALSNEKWAADVLTNKADVDKIKSYIEGTGKHKFWNDLAEWTDTFGGRVCGSDALEDSIDFLEDMLTTEGFDVHTEDVLNVPGWSRGNESAEMISPRKQKLIIFGLGGTVSTPPEGVTGDIMVVHDFEELTSRANEVPGKIVVFNKKWTGYDTSYRKAGAIEAGKLGAVASAISSLASYSLYTPHTGSMDYDDSVTKIPHFALTVEDADMFERMTQRGQRVSINVKLGGQDLIGRKSRHLIADYKGSTYPDEVVFLGGHLDSWDRGNGVQDDGIGIFMAIEVLRVIKALDLKPKRTIRFIGWTCEEVGIYGSEIYYEQHKEEAPDVSLGMEADRGLFGILGLGYSGSTQGQYVLEQVVSLVDPTYKVVPDRGSSADSGWWYRGSGVPVVNIWSDDREKFDNDPNYKEKYFYYHHTFADHMNAVDKDELDQNEILWAATTYVVANLEEKLPKDSSTSNSPQTAIPSYLVLSFLPLWISCILKVHVFA